VDLCWCWRSSWCGGPQVGLSYLGLAEGAISQSKGNLALLGFLHITSVSRGVTSWQLTKGKQ